MIKIKGNIDLGKLQEIILDENIPCNFVWVGKWRLV